jgi:hypothetical protein
MRRTLGWIAGRTPEEVVAALGMPDDEARAWVLKLLRRYPRLYSPDGKFSARQMQETARFYEASEGRHLPVTLDALIDARWAGRKP